jgi:hypothetical protein
MIAFLVLVLWYDKKKEAMIAFLVLVLWYDKKKEAMPFRRHPSDVKEGGD